MLRRLVTLLVVMAACAKDKPFEDKPPMPEMPGDEGEGGTGGTTTGPGGTGGGGKAGAAGTSGMAGAMGAGGSTETPRPDAAAGDAPVADARPRVDARPPSSMDAPPSPDVGGPAPPCKYAFCESFETFADGAPARNATWTPESSTLVIGSAHVARGMRALHVPDISSGQRFIRTTKVFPSLAGEHYGRLFLWIDAEPQAKPATVNHWTVAEISDRTTGGGFTVRPLGGLDYGAGNNQLFFNIEPHNATLGETGRGDTRSRLTPKVWHCFEWYYNQAKNQARTWWNGQERTALAWPDPAKPNDPKYTDPKWFFPPPKAFSVGWAEYQKTDVPWDVWIDEVALHTERIGCD